MKNDTKEYFESTLARGLEFEHGHAIEILHRTFPEHLIMNNQVDPVESTAGQTVGPRLYRGENREDEFIAPDFVMFSDDGKATWVDAKLKGASYPFKGRLYFSIDKKKHKQYCKFPPHIKDNFLLLFKHEKTKEIYLTEFREDPATIYFNNQYGKGETPVYYLDTMAKLFGLHEKSE